MRQTITGDAARRVPMFSRSSWERTRKAIKAELNKILMGFAVGAGAPMMMPVPARDVHRSDEFDWQQEWQEIIAAEFPGDD
jgi:hypothetical protein